MGNVAKQRTVKTLEPAIDSEKQLLRERVWRLLQHEGVARFPGAHGRIPNFVGSELCAEHLDDIAEWRLARTIKANPDSPQTAVRRRALAEGKIVYMAVPRLRERKCFLELDPRVIPSPTKAASIQGASSWGRAVGPDEMRQIDFIVCGSVVVNRRGERLGKGGGYSDLEFALARRMRLISESTPILTTVHPLQIVSEALPWRVHDIPVDYIVTPVEIIRTEPIHPRPKGVLWELLPEEKIAAIPILRCPRTGT